MVIFIDEKVFPIDWIQIANGSVSSAVGLQAFATFEMSVLLLFQNSQTNSQRIYIWIVIVEKIFFDFYFNQ